MNRILLTEYKKRLFFGLWEQNRPAELAFYERESGPQIGDICLARVKDVVPEIRAAFVQLAPGQIAYLPLEQAPEKLHCGDELAVQVTKEAQKTKDPVVTAHWSLTGRLAVLVTDSSCLSVSAKIHDTEWKAEAKERLKPLLYAQKSAPPSYGFIIRTGAYQAPWEELCEEVQALSAEYQRIRQLESTRACFSILRQSEPPWLSRLYGLSGAVGNIAEDSDKLWEIVTDSPAIYGQCRDFLSCRNMTEFFSLRLYNDTSYPLAKLYSLDTVTEDALRKNVWLKSGGYLVIEPTEAMVVIDVNTGKSESRRTKEEHILRLNLEAADEIARQMRLRNLSGMILIDFIDMKQSEHREQLMSHLREAVRHDPVGVSVIDMTKLGIVECTRRKTSRPLHEQLKGRKHDLSLSQQKQGEFL